MQKVFEIVQVTEMSVVTSSGNHCRDTSDETEYIETGRLVATQDNQEDCEIWIENFFSALADIQAKIRKSRKNNYTYLPEDKELLADMDNFYRKFLYIGINSWFDSYKFEIKVRYIA